MMGVSERLRSFEPIRIGSQDDSVVVFSMEKRFCVYIMSNVSKMLYVGVTNDLEKRVLQHKSKPIPGYTQKYNLFKLVYIESFGNIREAIRREKQIKGWLRAKKVALIESVNVHWNDLAEEHFKRSAKLKPVSS
jgi:putative endonuclease